ncbi:hypothetical protein PBY51_000062 [Eleginops maclovinus]|uniref:Uncharacterized protein n=1 Tax=Eleginops maclovinus TaxID=56733 RepID=A0AAN7XM86_ELEMC|nr:hypothetical protein PBY51_000062 [Eleginops maclovinus]
MIDALFPPGPEHVAEAQQNSSIWYSQVLSRRQIHFPPTPLGPPYLSLHDPSIPIIHPNVADTCPRFPKERQGKGGWGWGGSL